MNAKSTLIKQIPALTAATLLLAALPAQAYVGPGAGISVLGAVWGVVVAVVVVIGGLLFLPFKIMLRKRKLAKEAAEAEAASEETDTSQKNEQASPEEDTSST